MNEALVLSRFRTAKAATTFAENAPGVIDGGYAIF